MFGGMRLVDHLGGFEQAVLIDACRTGRHPPGTLTRHKPDAFPGSPRLASYHVIDFPSAIELARRMGAELPEDITVFAIEVQDVETIHEGCTPRVAASIDGAAEAIAAILGAEQPRRPR